MIEFEFVAVAYNEGDEDEDEMALIVKAKGDEALTRAFADAEAEEADLWVEQLVDRELRSAIDQLPKSADSVAFNDDAYPEVYTSLGYLCSGETDSGASLHVPLEDIHKALLEHFSDRHNWNYIDRVGWVSGIEIDIPDGESIYRYNNIVTDGPGA